MTGGHFEERSDEKSPILELMEKTYYIYIMTNKYRTVFYTGMSNDLVRRVYEHKNKIIEGFTKQYNVNCLVYFEPCNDPIGAIAREKQIKDYRRSKKITLIEKMNPQWVDLYDVITGSEEISRPMASK